MLFILRVCNSFLVEVEAHIHEHLFRVFHFYPDHFPVGVDVNFGTAVGIVQRITLLFIGINELLKIRELLDGLRYH